MSSGTDEAPQSTRLQIQLEALQSEVAHLSLQFHENGRNRCIDTTQDDQEEMDRNSMTCQEDIGEHNDKSGCRDTTRIMCTHAIAGTPDTVWTCKQQMDSTKQTPDEEADDVRNPSDNNIVRGASVSSFQSWSENYPLQIPPTVDSFQSIPERTTQMISDLANTKKLLHQVRRERDMYLIQFQDEKSKLQELTQKYMSLFEASERSNASLRMHLNTKEDVCQRQAELIRCLQESSTQDILPKGITHDRKVLDHLTLPTATTNSSSASKTLHNSSSIWSNPSDHSTFPMPLPQPAANLKDTTKNDDDNSSNNQNANEKKGKKDSTKKKIRNQRRRIPSRSRQTIFSSI